MYKDIQTQKEYVLSLYDGNRDCIETKRAERACMAAAFVGVLAVIDNQPSADVVPIKRMNYKWKLTKEQKPKTDELLLVTIGDESGDTPFTYVTVGWYLEEADC